VIFFGIGMIALQQSARWNPRRGLGKRCMALGNSGTRAAPLKLRPGSGLCRLSGSSLGRSHGRRLRIRRLADWTGKCRRNSASRFRPTLVFILLRATNVYVTRGLDGAEKCPVTFFSFVNCTNIALAAVPPKTLGPAIMALALFGRRIGRGRNQNVDFKSAGSGAAVDRLRPGPLF